MRTIFVLFLSFFIGTTSFAQKERDTVLKRCPVFITDTISSNNYFLEFQPATVKVTRNRGKLTILVQQKDQFFTLFFKDKKLEERKYKIVVTDPHRNDVEAKYSFRSGGSASYVSVSQGYLESTYDKEKQLWHIKVNGLLSNIAGTSVSYYRVRADFYIR